MTSGSNGIGDLLRQPLTLEERIKAHLKRTPTASELADDYVDPADRQNVRHRALISAVLNACFEHDFQDGDADIVEVRQQPDVWGELADARRSFLHDEDLLNAGSSAQLLAKPTKTDVALQPKSVQAKVKDLIIWLAVIHLHQEGLNSNFPTQQSVIDFAAKASRRSKSSFPKELSKMTTSNDATPANLEYFWYLVELAQKLARASGNEKNAFSLLLPAALGISAALLRNGY